MESGKRWTASDKHSKRIYLTQERWEHVIKPFNHPEMADFEQAGEIIPNNYIITA